MRKPKNHRQILGRTRSAVCHQNLNQATSNWIPLVQSSHVVTQINQSQTFLHLLIKAKDSHNRPFTEERMIIKMMMKKKKADQHQTKRGRMGTRVHVWNLLTVRTTCLLSTQICDLCRFFLILSIIVNSRAPQGGYRGAYPFLKPCIFQNFPLFVTPL